MPRASPPRFWAWYAAAWSPLVAVYWILYAVQGRMELEPTVLATLANVVPDALFGVLVVLACRRLWDPAQRRRVAAWLAAGALAFVGVATWSKAELNMAVIRATCKDVDWASYDRRTLVAQTLFSVFEFAVLTSVVFGLTNAARRAHAELLRARAELKALRAQLNPHFLFNTLHSVRALVRDDPEAAEEALEQLGDLLRYALRIQDAEEEGVLLREEWEFTRAYLALEELRLGPRLRVVAELSEEALAHVVPAFVLQTLVENAVRHGIAPRAEGGTLEVRAQLVHGTLSLEVRDDGPGGGAVTTRGTGKGLELVRQRLAARHGPRATLAVRADPGSGWAVTLRIPADEDEA